MARKVANVKLEGCRIMFRNFAGKEGKFNPAGRRSFCAILPDELAKEMEEEGWNIKYQKPRDEDDVPTPYIQVRVNYGEIQPDIYMITGRHKTRLDSESIVSLDYAEIENVDLIIRPYCWEMNGDEGITAYAKTMYVTVAEDEFADKYNFDSDDIGDIDDEIPFN